MDDALEQWLGDFGASIGEQRLELIPAVAELDAMALGWAMIVLGASLGPINLGNPNEFTIKQLAELVIELTNSKSKLEFLPLPQDDPKQRQPDISKASEILGWRPSVQLKEGLAKTIAYFETRSGLTSNAPPDLIR